MNKYRRSLDKFLITVSFILLYQSVITAQNEWQFLGLENLTIEHIYAKGDTIWAGIDSTYQRKIYYSYNGGEEWQKVDDTTPLINGWLRLLRVYPEDNRTIYARTFNGRGLKSTDGGESWQYLFPEAEPWNNAYKTKEVYLSPHNKKVMFSIIEWGSWDQLYRTTDGGETWEDVSAFVVSNHGSQISFTFDPIDSTTIYVAGDDNMGNTAFYVSYDLGEYWYILANSVSTKRILVDWNNNNIIYVFSFPKRSEDGGGNWTQIYNGLPFEFWNYWTSIIDPYDSAVLYMSTNYGVHKTTNKGDLWELIEGSEELNLNYDSDQQGKIENLFIDSSTHKMYEGTKKGVYVYNLLTSIDCNKEANPKSFTLSQNYPNPFNPNTVIEYSIPSYAISTKGERSNLNSTRFVTLKIYDILGKEVAVLVNEAQAPGNYKVMFKGKDLPSGIYIYQLTTGAVSLTNKMLLLK